MVQSIEDVRRRQQRDAAPRVPPHSLDAEESLLGAMMLSADAVSDALGAVQAEHFYKPAHRHIYSAIGALTEVGEPVDSVTVAEELRRQDLLEAIGGDSTIVGLLSAAPSIRNAEKYARIVHDHALLRRLIAVGSELSDIGYSMPSDVIAALDEAEGLVYDVAQGKVSSTVGSLDDFVGAVCEDIQRRYDAKSELTGTASGFHDLDRKLLGLQPQALLVLGARPAMGKSAFALNIAAHVAIREQKPALFFSLEMGAVELTKRLLAAEARIDSTRMRNGKFEETDWTRFQTAMSHVGGAPLFIDENPGLTIMEIRAKARRLQAQVHREYGELGLIVVDYLQLMSGRSSAENRQVEVAEISRGLKILARELKVPVLALSQLSRGIEQRPNKHPQLSDLRESGAIEQDADVVMFIHREEQVDPDNIEVKGLAEILIAKHRSGPTGKVQLAFIERYTKFENVART
jgi:replicative DNA helicase